MRLVVMLILCAVSLLSAAQTFGQGYTIVTTESTATSVLNETYSHLIPTSSYVATSTVQETVMAWTETNPGIGILYCYTAWESFSAAQGQAVEGTVKVSPPDTLIVYILSDSQYNAWHGANDCDPGDVAGSLWHLGAFHNFQTVADVNWSPSANGTYWLLAQTYSATPVTITVSLTSYVVQASTVTLYSTSFSMYGYSIYSVYSATLSSILSEQQGNTGQPNVGLSTFPLLIIGIIVLAIIIIGYLAAKRKNKT